MEAWCSVAKAVNGKLSSFGNVARCVFPLFQYGWRSKALDNEELYGHFEVS
jgi:hypothetical protein